MNKRRYIPSIDFLDSRVTPVAVALPTAIPSPPLPVVIGPETQVVLRQPQPPAPPVPWYDLPIEVLFNPATVPSQPYMPYGWRSGYAPFPVAPTTAY